MDIVTPIKECSFDRSLSFINSNEGIKYALSVNSNLKRNLFPLTKYKLLTYYDATDFKLKKNFKDKNCAADVLSYYLQTYGLNEGSGANTISTGEGEGLAGWNPFGEYGFDLSKLFDKNILLLLLLGFIVLKKK